jgi:hypothetical protein
MAFMWPIVRRFGLMALGVVALWLLTILALNLTLYSAGGFVMGYLSALENGNHGLAASKAGLSDVPAVLPLASEPIHNPRIASTGALETGDIVVEVAYELAGVEEHTTFVVRETEPVLWFFNSWAFQRSPIARLELTIVGDNRAVINGTELNVARLGVPPRTSVLVPGVYEASLNTEWVEGESVVRAATEIGSVQPIRLTVAPSARLKDAANEAVEDLLDDCADQGVLQPASCPFGISIDDRVIGIPQWEILDYPDVRLGLGGDRASWSMSARRGVAEVTVQVQSLFDGTISEEIELVSFDLYGVVRGTTTDAPVLNFD